MGLRNIFRSAVSLLLVFLYVSTPTNAAVKKYQFNIQVSSVSRLCHAKPIVTVNGQFPGPTVYAREGDRVIINVTNFAQYNMSIHWHGLKQYRNGWADGPAYITQCPIQTGRSYTYDFNVTGQRGTLWWHAHILWLRATVYGAIVIMPEQGKPYPFPQPDFEHNLVLGEWWNEDVETLVKQGEKLGVPPKLSDAHTINGKPGPLFPCSEKYTYAIEVEQGKTYLLRIVNAALNDELFFAVAGHTLTVIVASLNNITFVMPRTALLQAHYYKLRDVYTPDFPDRPTIPFNYTGAPLTANLQTNVGPRPRISWIKFNSTVELVVQDTNLLTVESHPFHLHGYNFFVVGTGIGNFDPVNDPKKYNLVDPPERNTVSVPTGGWAAIRFRADNPGVWFFHCHLEVHTGWGLKTAFVVENGPHKEHSVLPPPKDLPAC
ncbi:Laccase-11 [Striga hermonthica]|uniref:Laccase-11 n=1 Tax=Striga hermonthica TaxID=68872 RepID=A0A9N7MM07_STRHE|nr:Laccase-11 [Striga hermonthica]